MSQTHRSTRTISLSDTLLHAARMLLFLMSLLLAVMPYLEHVWAFDQFLKGGQDFEFTMLAILAVLCLVLLLGHSLSESLLAWLSLSRSSPQAGITPDRKEVRLAKWGRSSSYELRSLLTTKVSAPLQI